MIDELSELLDEDSDLEEEENNLGKRKRSIALSDLEDAGWVR